jgi:nitrogenase-stabilizing/protective protein
MQQQDGFRFALPIPRNERNLPKQEAIPMNELIEAFEDELSDLSSAEDFLDYFGVEYDARVVQVNRLHILQRFHDYLENASLPEPVEMRRALYRTQLQRAYRDFVESDALSEKVFKVFHRFGPQPEVKIPLAAIGRNP